MAPGNRKFPKRAAASESAYSLMEFMKDFPDDDACLEWLWRTRYSSDGTHAHCPKCDQERAFSRYGTSQQRQSWTCTSCGHHLHPTAGLIFHKSSTSLHLWFYAIYLITSTKTGISAKQLERELGVTYKTAWRMFNLIRNQLMTQDDHDLSGTLEVDDTYIGPREKGRGRKSRKTGVFGIVERGGRVAAIPVQDGKAIEPAMKARILGPEYVYTDEWIGFNWMRGEPWKHRRVRHAIKVYVKGDVHTNSIEGFWSLVKGGIRGVYHGVSTKWLLGYLNEYAWRYNHRDDNRATFLLLLLRAATSTL